MAKKQSRVVRWQEAIAKIEEGVATLTALNTEYEDWKSKVESAETEGSIVYAFDLVGWKAPDQQLKEMLEG